MKFVSLADLFFILTHSFISSRFEWSNNLCLVMDPKKIKQKLSIKIIKEFFFFFFIFDV